MLGSFYRTIVSDALAISWRNRYLWVFGLFAALLGSGGEYEIFFKAIGKSAHGTAFPTLGVLYSSNLFSVSALSEFFSKLFTNTFSFIVIVAILALFLLIVAFLVWLASVSQAALVHSADRLGSGKKNDFAGAYAFGRKTFLPVLGLNLVYYLVVAISLAIIGLPGYLVSHSGGSGAIWFYLLSFLVFLPVAIIVSFITKYGLAFVVLKKEKFLDALFLGWQLFYRNWLISLEMVVIILAVDVLFGVATIVAMIFVSIPFVIFALLMSYVGAGIAMTLMYVFGMIAAFLALVVIGTFVVSFQYAAWTMLFNRLTAGRGALSKLVRLFHFS